MPSIQSHGALPAAVISGIINLAAAAHYRRRRILSRRRFFRHLKHCDITGAIIAVRTAAFLLRFLLPSISIARHYRRRLYPALSIWRRRITGGGYIRRYQFGGGGALPAAHSFAILSTALLPAARLSLCARRRFFCGFFCRQYNRTAHYRRRLYPALSIWRRRRITGGAFFRHLKHCAITGGAVITLRTAAFLSRFLLPSIQSHGALPAAAFLSPPPIAVIYRRHLLSAP